VARRGRRSLIVLVVLVVVLGGLFVVADRVAANAAESRIAEQAQAEMKNRGITSASRPAASVGGFPFLTQVLGGTYQKVTITVDHPQSEQAKLDKLTITANQVHAPLKTLTSGAGQVTADTVSGTANLGWDVVQTLVDQSPLKQIPGLDVSRLKITVKDNKLNMAAPIAFGPLKMTLQAAGTLTVAEGQVRLQIENLSAGNGSSASTVPQRFLDQYKDAFNVKIAIPQMPYKLVIDKVTTTDKGVVVTATAANVVLSGQA
jgi:hypothetical protein